MSAGLSPEALRFQQQSSAARIPGPLLRPTAALARALLRRRGAPALDRARRGFDGTTERRTHDGVPTEVLLHRSSDPAADYLVHLHGGAFLLGDAVDPVVLQLAAATGLDAVCVDYSLTPGARFPVALDECWRAWRAVTAERTGRPVLVGVSAGGNLALGLLQRLLEAPDATLPAAVVLVTPWTDLSATGESRERNEGVDPLIRWDGQLDKAAAAYAGGRDVADPLLSPVHASWQGVRVPTLVTTGTRDLFESDCRRLHDAMLRDGVPVTLDVAEGMWHAYQALPHLPEARESVRRTTDFVRSALAAPPA